MFFHLWDFCAHSLMMPWSYSWTAAPSKTHASCSPISTALFFNDFKLVTVSQCSLCIQQSSNILTTYQSLLIDTLADCRRRSTTARWQSSMRANINTDFSHQQWVTCLSLFNVLVTHLLMLTIWSLFGANNGNKLNLVVLKMVRCLTWYSFNSMPIFSLVTFLL